ncbi:MAG: valine--tRNA ligase [Bacteroidota bacterium]
MNLSTHYDPNTTEARWYAHWMDKNYFHSEPDEREPFTIVIPPPNVTGVLHMGHMLNNTIQDILIRKARLEGKNACWVPGTDHASIATEAKVVKKLRAKGIKKSDLSREEFLAHAWEWKEEYGGKILDQLQKLGASCDWERTRFTMEPKLSAAVLKVFVSLYKKGKLYRRLRMVNWDSEAQTVLSNEEVIYGEENARLFHIRYKIEGTNDEYITIATQRPETIMADTAIAVHPEDERFQHLIGKTAIIPLINRAIPIIADTYVELDFGTGALKITPAHDPNDYEVGQRHGLPVIDILTPDGKLNDEAKILIGKDRFAARKKIKPMLEEADALVKIEDYRTKIGRSERTDSVVEPRLSKQWFVDMKQFAADALEAVRSKEVTFYPEHMFNMYHSWLNEDNIRDWCISRQLWWGQRIPAWYYEDDVFVAETEEEALAQAKEKYPNITLAELKQDEDVLDTWFSSWLWPMSVFDGFENQEELKYYYPTNVLVTGWDIMFFWVARMIISGYEFSPELLGKDHAHMPFKDVYFTGMVRDEKRQKMSKSKGNSPDALDLMDNYGADGVRFGMLLSGAAGNDIIFDAPFDKATKSVLNESQRCLQGRNFCNKMWNALRLIKGWDITEDAPSAVNKLAVQWFENKFQQTLESLEQSMKDYRLSEALMTLYNFIWGDFCSWYLEMVKPAYGDPIDRTTLNQTIEFYERLMTILHPFMPFVTEEIWHQLKERAKGEDCIISNYPSAQSFDKTIIKKVERAKEVTAKVREIRNTKGISPKEALSLYVQESPNSLALYELSGLKAMIEKMANLTGLYFTSMEEVESSIGFVSGTEKYFLEVQLTIDVEAEREKLQKELDHQRGFVKGVEKKLSNERFVNNAPAAVVDKERKKLADGQARIKILEESLVGLG